MSQSNRYIRQVIYNLTMQIYLYYAKGGLIHFPPSFLFEVSHQWLCHEYIPNSLVCLCQVISAFLGWLLNEATEADQCGFKSKQALYLIITFELHVLFECI